MKLWWSENHPRTASVVTDRQTDMHTERLWLKGKGLKVHVFAPNVKGYITMHTENRKKRKMNSERV